MSAAKVPFEVYLKNAVDLALKMEEDETDTGNLYAIHRAARNGHRKNWTAITGQRFLESYLWCIAGIRIKASGLAKKWDKITKHLFRKCNPKRIKAEKRVITKESATDKLVLNEKKVDAFLRTATLAAK